MFGLTLDVCLCGHATSAHRHYRGGSDWAICECGHLSRMIT